MIFEFEKYKEYFNWIMGEVGMCVNLWMCFICIVYRDRDGFVDMEEGE